MAARVEHMPTSLSRHSGRDRGARQEIPALHLVAAKSSFARHPPETLRHTGPASHLDARVVYRYLTSDQFQGCHLLPPPCRAGPCAAPARPLMKRSALAHLHLLSASQSAIG